MHVTQAAGIGAYLASCDSAGPGVYRHCGDVSERHAWSFNTGWERIVAYTSIDEGGKNAPLTGTIEDMCNASYARFIILGGG